VAVTGKWNKNKTVTTFSELCTALVAQCENAILDIQPDLQDKLIECIQNEIYDRPETVNPRNGMPYYKRTGGLINSAKVRMFNRGKRGQYSTNVGVEIYHDDAEIDGTWDSNPEEFEHGSLYSDSEDSRAGLDIILNDGKQGQIFKYGGGFGPRTYIDVFEEEVMNDSRIIAQIQKNLDFGSAFWNKRRKK
jgi:hypothetical protein